MVELLGILIAALLVTLGWLAWRAVSRLAVAMRGVWRRPRRPKQGGERLRASRALARTQAVRIAALTSELDRTRRALRFALAAPAVPDTRFRRAKRAFAALFHPDRLRCPQPELALRVRIFQQYWQVLRRIERS